MKVSVRNGIDRLFGRHSTKETGSNAGRRQTKRETVLACENLEARVVLTRGGFGGLGGLVGPPVAVGLMTDLSQLGVVPGGGRGGFGFSTGSSSSSTQLATDIQKLQTDLQSLASKSGVTVADLSNLAADEAAIRATGFRPDATKLLAAVTELATAVAGGTDTTQAKTDFNAVFAGSSVSQTVIDKAFADLTQTITDSKVTTADLDTIAADRKAIQTDLSTLQASGGFGDKLRGGGGSLIGSLATLGVVTKTGRGGFGGHDGFGLRAPRGASAAGTQLATDLQKLQTDLQTLASKSGVTVADTTSLQADAKAIADAGFRPDAVKLQTAVSELATAIAGGTDTTQAKTDFNAVFTGSSVTQAVIDKALADLTQTIIDSKVTVSDLQLIAADRAAIQTDAASLVPSGPLGCSTTGASTNASSGTSTAGTGTTSTTTFRSTSSNRRGRH